jgi:protein-L-isoaspartate(D-aspartate) O-methyltransferase
MILISVALPELLSGQQATNWEHQAREMVQSQLVSRGIKNTKLLQVITNTPRHLFVPEKYQDMAYRDRPLPIGHQQTISQPYIVALMTEWLALEGNEKVLEIGTGSGYQAAILSQLVAHVYTIEIVQPLAVNSAKLLKQLGYNNVEVRYGDGYAGWHEHAPFDRIILTAAPEEIPQKLVDQLALGGRMILPVGTDYQQLVLITKNQTGISKKIITDVRFVPMIHGNK